MNLSSVVITLRDGAKNSEVTKSVEQVQNCEIVASEGDKIVAVIECESLDAELASFKALEALPGVSTVAMIYSYQNLDDDIAKANSNDIAQIVRDIDSMDASQVKYNGNPSV